MELLIIIGLAGWVWWQTQRMTTLARRVSDLELKLAAAMKPPAAPADQSALVARPDPAPAPLLLDTPAPAEEPLLLDTPIPDVSNDQAEAPVRPAEAPPPIQPAQASPLVLTKVTAPTDMAAPLLLTDVAPPLQPASAPAPQKRERRFDQWLVENGFAWLGAVALALAGVYLVAYATQQNWFTPGVRLVCALVLGIALIGASEYVRRGAQNKLVAALLAGAGAATFYATAWAAHGLYHYLDAAAGAVMLTLCAAILLGLSLIHGQALAILAITAAFLAPPLTSIAIWSSTAVTLYVAAVGAAGFGLAALRRWPWAGAAALAGLYFWFAAAIDMNDIRRALALISIASVGGVAIALRRGLTEEPNSNFPWTQARQIAPTIAICASSVFLLLAWIAVATASPLGVLCIATFHVALAAAAIRARLAAPAALAVSIAALVLGFAVSLSASARAGAFDIYLYAGILFAAFTVTASALGARAHRTARGIAAGAGSIGAALLLLLAASTRPDWHSLQAWAPLFSGAALLFAAARRAAQDVAEPGKDRAVGLWTGGGFVLALTGIESAIPAAARSMADAVLALACAEALVRLHWRTLRWAALVGAGFALAHSLSTELIGATLAGALPLGRALVYLTGAAAALFAANRTLTRAQAHQATAEALSSASLITLLIGLFLALRWVAAAGASARLDDFTETALRALILMAAGYLALPRVDLDLGMIARWRGHVLMVAGFLYAVLALGVTENPWWGATPAQIEGPPVLDGLLLAFAAPAALAFVTAARLYGVQRNAAQCYAATSGLLFLLWSHLEIRRGFHPFAMASASVGVFEAACYAIAALMLALLVATPPLLRTQADGRPFTRDLARITDAAAWSSLVFSVIVMLVLRHPWWGAQDAGAANAQSAGLAVLAQAWAATLAFGLGRALSRGRGVDATRFGAAATAALFTLSFAHAAVRWLYHGAGMDEREPFVGLEGFAHTLLPLAFVLTASALTVRLPGRDNVRAYLIDLEAIWSVAIWPALLFTALGLWLAFNPWWGGEAMGLPNPLYLGLALAAYPFAAGLSLLAPRIPNAAFPTLMAPGNVLIATGHLLVGLTLLVRAIFHGLDIRAAGAPDVEMWSYSAAWVVFGAAAVGLGTWRNNAALRWAGLAILCATALKVFFIDAGRLSGIIRALSFLGFGVVVTLVAIGSRRFRRNPGDLLKVIPSPRRERRNLRR